MSELVTRAGRSAQWPAHRGSLNTFVAQLREQALEQEIRGECGHCGAEFVGLFREEREWFRVHVCEVVA